ncbi:hypothetical protein E2493_02705 [Sphingomonas parva]|uniref:Rod shape-determining protein MreD n=1 Tax=Sphingomonas parva TaxID=2555898 RepID=A0A4Y8ZWC4_9SPHN|nr:hypothetical protein [Sphingomonas parva]TFI59767.1 hypothetical protein E2493_02705 [Sphingomonas parva]
MMMFAFLLNYPWELIQAPLYQGMASAPHWTSVLVCSRAAVGDAVIAFIAFCTACLAARTPSWPMQPNRRGIIVFMGVGLVITVVIEHLATSSTSASWGWRYSSMMPLVPLIGAGLSPVLQWLILPPLVVWLARRHLQGA